jgi:hypothetical protein
LVYISLNLHGTRAVQTLVDRLAVKVIEDLLLDQSIEKSINHHTLNQVISALQADIVELTMDMHGNHVI